MGSATSVDIERVVVRRSEGAYREVAEATDLGTLGSGSSLTVPLTASFDETGLKRLRIHLYGEAANGSSVHVQRPVVVRVSDQHPLLDVSLNETVTGTTGHGHVTIANGLQSRARNLELSLTETALSLVDGRVVLSGLDSGESITRQVRYRPSESGAYDVRARLQYVVGNGEVRHVETTVPVSVEPLRNDVVVEATRERGAESTVAVRLINRGNARLANVTLRGVSRNASIPRQLLDPIPPDASRETRLNVSLAGERASVRVQVSYDVGDRHDAVSDRVVVESTPGQIELTGTDTTAEDGRIKITGSASNVGLTTANSVIVGVKDTPRVSPAAPTREYFVGTVPESDFVSFDVYARVDGPVSSIPLEVSYLVDGDRHTRTVHVPYEGGETNVSAGTTGSDEGWLLPAALGVVVLLGVGGVLFVGWRNSRDRS
ncbi:hypothetical protein [Halorientalis pallida]|uniref:Uncharacterized protein n=1 Tax=Halorientalis pallida TaxID=2479928 RepID=A0A498KZY3_9EURY|nr:hypothetical protein [Halorientalis pallida]RXK50143.1 hypothetical protein EAF64_06150 [Halorientalis pallida]